MNICLIEIWSEEYYDIANDRSEVKGFFFMYWLKWNFSMKIDFFFLTITKLAMKWWKKRGKVRNRGHNEKSNKNCLLPLETKILLYFFKKVKATISFLLFLVYQKHDFLAFFFSIFKLNKYKKKLFYFSFLHFNHFRSW